MSRSDAKGGCGSTATGCVLMGGGALFLSTVLFAMVPSTRSCSEGCARTLVGREVIQVTIPEGWNRFQIASRLANAGVIGSEQAFIDTTEDAEVANSLGIHDLPIEGYLFPDTYEFHRDEEPAFVVWALVKVFKQKMGALEKQHVEGLEALRKLGDDPQRVAVILASIVEMEAAKTEERKLVAGVFLNRLLLETFPTRRLQADPTVSYGCIAARPVPDSCVDFDGKLRKAHLQDSTNPYNTYVHPGLPPGPICNPGAASLEAVLDPGSTDYIYFVSKGDGTHQFSVTLEEHGKAVKQYRLGTGQ